MSDEEPLKTPSSSAPLPDSGREEPEHGNSASAPLADATLAAPEIASATPMQYVCRYGVMRMLGVMDAKSSFCYGDDVVVRTDRGTEIATVLCEATPAAVGAMHEPTHGIILRRTSGIDRGDWSQLSERSQRDLEICQRGCEAVRLSIQLVDVERLLGGERVVVYFISESRVDFRELVKWLGREFKTRIEMRQIGSRDEAKLLADFGDCGQEVCCSRFLSKMPPVSMKMAKLQRASLDPAKISGRCGRLKCCLRYEFDAYEALAAELPPIGAVVLTREGNSTVIAQDILAGQLIVRTEDQRPVMIAAGDVIQIISKNP